MPTRFQPARAEAVAAGLDLDLDAGLCIACLGIVAIALEYGDSAEIARELRRITPDLWADGLSEQALPAVRSACERGVPDAHAALEDLEGGGGRSVTARAIVRRLAEELQQRTRRAMRIAEVARERLPLAPPELN